MERINTVIFDMDGTVLDTLQDLTISMNYVMRSFNMPEHKEDEYRQFFGNGIRYAMEKAVPEENTAETIDRMLPVFKEHYDVHCLDRTKPYDGIPGLLAELDSRGYKLAIVSNKIDSAVKELNDRFFYPSVKVAIGERNGIKRKPAPDTVYEALKELESDPEEAVYVGDSEVDFMTAKNAGLPCLSVLWGFRSKEYLESIGAYLFADKPDDILDIIKQGTDRIRNYEKNVNREGELQLGPFQGKTACTRIPVGKGVCGSAVAEKQIMRVADVHAFPGHIACDSASASEIVIPLFSGGQIIGVLDIDSPVKERFSQDDEEGLLRIVRIIEKSLN